MLLLLVGQSSLALSTLTGFWFACISRLCVGLGGKNISVARSTYSSDWFIGKELAFALSLSIGITRFGAISVMTLAPIVYNWTENITFTFLFADIFVLLSTICGLIAILIDQHVIDASQYKRAKQKTKEIKLP